MADFDGVKNAKFHTAGMKKWGDDRYSQKMEQLARWRAEHEHNDKIEKNLQRLSSLSFDTVDYSPLLERTPWTEPPPKDYSYMVADAIKEQEEKYFWPLATRGGIIFLLLVIFLIIPNSVTVWIMLTAGAAVIVSLLFTIRERDHNIVMARQAAITAIAQLEQQEKEQRAWAKAKHDEKERKRIDMVERLLAGDESAVFFRLNEVMPKLGLPFPCEALVELYEEIPYITVYLPEKNVVPTRRSSLLQGGMISYQDKEALEVNKQYMEICASLLLTIVSAIYGNIPSFDVGYASAISRADIEDSCLINMDITRDKLTLMCAADTGIEALQIGEAVFENDTALEFIPIDLRRPPEWANLDKRAIKSMLLKIFK